jgi:hypothetical protein
MLIQSWRPKRRNVVYYDKPDYVPDWIYTEAKTAKKCYNEEWEFWVYRTSIDQNCSQALAEDACIRGLKKAIYQLYFVFGPKVGKWYEDFLEMGDIFEKVSHPQYLAQLSPLPEGTKENE